MRFTVRARLTALYGTLFVVGGLVLVLVVYLLVRANLVSQLTYAVTRSVPEDWGTAVPATPLPTATAQEIAETSQETVLTKLLLVSGLSLVALAVIAVAVAWWVSGRVLRPLHRISETARVLSSDNLHRRIALDGPKDELTELADTFDGMLDRLEAAFESQRRFIANASHELRTPLAIQRAAVQIGLSDDDSDRVLQVREQLLTANRRSERLIDGLLVLARSDRGLEHRERVALHEVVEYELAQHVDAAASRSIKVERDLKPCWVDGDPVLIGQLVGNLVGNSVRHNVDGGEVKVYTDQDHGLLVTNSGTEVPAVWLPELFEPFRRGAGRTASAEGAGLGLSIVRSIVQAHGGTVRSRPRPGGGLEVYVHIPASSVNDTGVPAVAGAQCPNGRHPRPTAGLGRVRRTPAAIGPRRGADARAGVPQCP